MLIPQHVIRFYGNIDYVMQTIAYKEISCLHPDLLNDPFDPLCEFLTDFDSSYASIIGWVSQNHPADYYSFCECLTEKGWQAYIHEIADYGNQLRKTSFVFSTCAVNKMQHPKDNLYMWGHYANGHRGVAVEFDSSLLARASLPELKNTENVQPSPIGGAWTEIVYVTNPPKVTCESIYQFVMREQEPSGKLAFEGTEIGKIIEQRVRSKCTVWEREHEWRLWWKDDETALKTLRLSLPAGTVKSLYMGCLVSDTIKDGFVKEMKRNFPEASVFAGKMVKGDFALAFEQIL